MYYESIYNTYTVKYKKVTLLQQLLHSCFLFFLYNTLSSHSERTVLEFLNNFWGLGTEFEYGYRTGPPEPVFLNVYGVPELISRNEIRQPM